MAGVTKPTGVQKFGRGSVSTTQRAIWDHGQAYTFNDTPATYYLSSSNNADTHDVVVSGHDSTGAEVQYTTALTGQTQVALTVTSGGAAAGTMVRAYRAWVDDTTAPAGDIYVAELDGTISAGVPQNNALIKAKITAGFNQTLMAIWSCPANFTGELHQFYVAGTAQAQTARGTFYLWRKPWGKVARVQQAIDLAGGEALERSFSHRLSVSARDDWYITGAVNSGTVPVSAGFDVELVVT